MTVLFAPTENKIVFPPLVYRRVRRLRADLPFSIDKSIVHLDC